MRKIQLGGLVTLTAIVGLAVYFGRIDAEAKSIKPKQIKAEQDQALEEFGKKTEKVIEIAQRSPGSVENVRAFVTKSDVDKVCPSKLGSLAAHVPFSYLGKTGQEICAANYRDRKRCAKVPFVWVSNDNQHGTYIPENKACNEPLEYAWPWGGSFDKPNTSGSEWAHGNTWVVCCYK